MGSPKALLPVPPNDRPLALHLADIFAAGGCDDVVITVPPLADAPEVRSALERGTDGIFRIEENAYWDQGLIGSIATAIHLAADDVDALVFSPVDAPHTTASLVRALLDRLRATGADAAVVEADGKRGHPVAASRRLFGALQRMKPGGAKAILDSANVSVVDWGDPRVTLNVNTKREWERSRAWFDASESGVG